MTGTLTRVGGSVAVRSPDAPPERIRNWLDTGKDLLSAICGTCQGDFADLEKFAAAAWVE